MLQSQRYELHLPYSERHFDIIAAEENGLYLYRNIYSHDGEHLQLIKLDTAFHENWSGSVPLEKNYLLMGKKSYKGKLYLLLRYRDFTKNNFYLYIVDAEGNYMRHTIKGYIPISPAEFQITDKAVLIGGYYSQVPLVLYFSLTTFTSRVLPGMFNENGELTHVKTYEDGTFDVLISATNHLRQRTMWIKNYDPDGNLNRNLALETEGNKHLIFGRSMKTQDNMQLVAGVYGSRSTEYSHGIFIASIDPQGYQQIRYYHFGDLENFFKYMKAKREQRIKSRIERKKIKGKKVRLYYRFLVHELVPYKDQFILLGEAFYPKYITMDHGYGSFFTPMRTGGGTIHNGRIFDGYYYTHAVVMGFQPDGDLVWDNSFEINDVKTFTLEQFVKLEIQENKIALFYVYDNHIRTKIIQDDEVLEGKNIDPIRTGNEGEMVKMNSAEVNKLEYWYKDYLFAYGIQEIERTKGFGRRRVFYINKVRHPD